MGISRACPERSLRVQPGVDARLSTGIYVFSPHKLAAHS
jgi:hypothetical protein